MITHEQVAGLQVGDVVELTSTRWPDVTMRGPLHDYRGYLSVGPWAVRNSDGSPYADLGEKSTRTLTVVSRAPRPLYVNHPRTEPVPGDVVRDADDDLNETWVYARHDCGAPWYASRGKLSVASRESLPARLRLLVDGETGQVVP